MDSMPPTVQDLADLAAIVGADHVLTEPDRRRGYEQAARYGGGLAAAVLRPASACEVSQVLSLCRERGVRVLPQSGNTGLVLGSTPDASGTQIVLSLDRMRRIVEVCPTNRSVIVEGGVRLSQLNLALEPYGLCLPIDLGADPMIGGMAATNTGGARFLRHGDMRAHILGLEAVLANGDILQLGGALRKDNSRLGLKDILIGSWGAMAVITRVTLEVHPRPRQTSAALLVPTSSEHSLAILMHLEAVAGDFLSAFEAMSGGAIAAALELETVRNPFAAASPHYALLVELATAVPAEIVSLEEILLKGLEPLLGGTDPHLLDAIIAPPERLWALRHAISEGLRAKGDVIGFDLAFQRNEVIPFRVEAIELLAEQAPEVTVCDFGHLGDGGVHFNLLAPKNLPSERIAAIRALVVNLACDRYSGSFSGEHGVGAVNQSAYRRYVPDLERYYACAVAGAFESNGLVGAERLDPA